MIFGRQGLVLGTTLAFLVSCVSRTNNEQQTSDVENFEAVGRDGLFGRDVAAYLLYKTPKANEDQKKHALGCYYYYKGSQNENETVAKQKATLLTPYALPLSSIVRESEKSPRSKELMMYSAVAASVTTGTASVGVCYYGYALSVGLSSGAGAGAWPVAVGVCSAIQGAVTFGTFKLGEYLASIPDASRKKMAEEMQRNASHPEGLYRISVKSMESFKATILDANENQARSTVPCDASAL